MTGPTPRPELLDLSPYVGGEAHLPGVARVIRLASNESAAGPSPAAVAAYRDLAGDLARYPDGGSTELRDVLAQTYGLEAGRIVCGNGSDEIIVLLARAYAGPGHEVLYSAHGFAMYPIAATAAGATPVTASETELTTNVDALLAQVGPRTRIVFVANPNNPTGTYLSDDEIRRLHAGLPEEVLLVIDNAYAEYVRRNDYADASALVDEAANVVMTRTFSKIHALAALRVGWAYCPAAVADVLNRSRGPFNVNAPAHAAAIASLGDPAHLERARAQTEQAREAFRAAALELGLEAPASVGNFQLVRFPDTPGRDAQAAYAHLTDRGILTRRMAGYGLPDCLRVGIGTDEEMAVVGDAFQDFAER